MNNIVDLRNRHLLKQQQSNNSNNPQTSSATTTTSTTRSSDGSASQTILDRIKSKHRDGNGSNSEDCVFQKLSLDTTVVRQLQNMKEFQDVLPQDEHNQSHDDGAPSNGQPPPIATTNINGGGNQKPPGKAPLPSYLQKSNKKKLPAMEGPSIFIPVASDRIRIQDMKAVLKDEYAARYCELIGVAPSQQNMNLVQRLMPFEKCKISQSAQQNGVGRTERRNNVVIQPAFHAPKVQPPSAEEIPFELLTLDVNASDQSKQLGQSATLKGGATSSEGKEANGGEGAPSHAKLSFEEYKQSFVYPFNLNERFETTTKSPNDVGNDCAGQRKGIRSPHPPTSSSSGRQGAAQQVLSETPPLSTAQKLAMQDALLEKLRAQRDAEASATSKHQTANVLSSEELEAIETVMRQGASSAPVASESSASIKPQSSHGHLRSPGAVATPSNSSSSPLSSGSTKEVVDALIRKELQQPWAPVENTEVKHLQMQFVRDFPFYRYEGRLSEHDILELKTKLIQDDVTEIIVHAMRFFFAAYIAPLSAVHQGTTEAADKDALFLSVYRLVLKFSTVHAKSTMSMEEMPLAILEFRVILSGIVTHKLPTFCKYEEGKGALRRMDECIKALLDPFGLMSHIVVLESTPQAQKVLRQKRLPPRMSSLATSPLVQFIMGDGVRSTEAKKLARPQPEGQHGLEELKRHLTPTVRAELLRIVTQEKICRE